MDLVIYIMGYIAAIKAPLPEVASRSGSCVLCSLKRFPRHLACSDSFEGFAILKEVVGSDLEEGEIDY